MKTLKYMNENDLCKKLIPFLEANHEELEISDRLKSKVERHASIAKSLLNYYKVETKLSDPFTEYSRYILTSGTESEKTAFAEGITTKILIRDSELVLD